MHSDKRNFINAFLEFGNAFSYRFHRTPIEIVFVQVIPNFELCMGGLCKKNVSISDRRFSKACMFA